MLEGRGPPDRTNMRITRIGHSGIPLVSSYSQNVGSLFRLGVLWTPKLGSQLLLLGGAQRALRGQPVASENKVCTAACLAATSGILPVAAFPNFWEGMGKGWFSPSVVKVACIGRLKPYSTSDLKYVTAS